jgi:hypothetical protein
MVQDGTLQDGQEYRSAGQATGPDSKESKMSDKFSFLPHTFQSLRQRDLATITLFFNNMVKQEGSGQRSRCEEWGSKFASSPTVILHRAHAFAFLQVTDNVPVFLHTAPHTLC